MSKCQNLYLGWRIELDDKPITRPKEEWIAAILQNSRYAFLSIHNGQDKLEMFQKSFKIDGKKLRKTKVTSAKDVVSKINAWIKKVS